MVIETGRNITKVHSGKPGCHLLACLADSARQAMTLSKSEETISVEFSI